MLQSDRQGMFAAHTVKPIQLWIDIIGGDIIIGDPFSNMLSHLECFRVSHSVAFISFFSWLSCCLLRLGLTFILPFFGSYVLFLHCSLSELPLIFRVCINFLVDDMTFRLSAFRVERRRQAMNGGDDETVSLCQTNTREVLRFLSSSSECSVISCEFYLIFIWFRLLLDLFFFFFVEEWE